MIDHNFSKNQKTIPIAMFIEYKFVINGWKNRKLTTVEYNLHSNLYQKHVNHCSYTVKYHLSGLIKS